MNTTYIKLKDTLDKTKADVTTQEARNQNGATEMMIKLFTTVVITIVFSLLTIIVSIKVVVTLTQIITRAIKNSALSCFHLASH